MKTSVGIVRKCDFVGRIVIPVEYRHVLKLVAGTPLRFLLRKERHLS